MKTRTETKSKRQKDSLSLYRYDRVKYKANQTPFKLNYEKVQELLLDGQIP